MPHEHYEETVTNHIWQFSYIQFAHLDHYGTVERKMEIIVKYKDVERDLDSPMAKSKALLSDNSCLELVVSCPLPSCAPTKKAWILPQLHASICSVVCSACLGDLI